MLVLVIGSHRDDAEFRLHCVRIKPVEVISEAGLENSLRLSRLLSFPDPTSVMWHCQEIAFERTFSPLHDVLPLGDCRVAREQDLLFAPLEDEDCTCEVRVTVVNSPKVRHTVRSDE